MTWERRRRCELGAAFLDPVALFLGMWGIILGQDWMIILYVLLRIPVQLLAPGRWKALTLDAVTFLPCIVMSYKLALFDSLPLMANAVLPWLIISSIGHILSAYGNSARLLEKLIESGEFQADHTKLERWMAGELRSPPRFSGS
jgi:hypothetical protein